MEEERPFYRYYIDEKEDKMSQKLFHTFIAIFLVFYLLVISLSFAFYQNFSYISISGKSMQSTLNPSPVLVQTKRGSEYLQDGVYIKHTKDVDYGDIVVLDPSEEKEDDTIIKRVLALEGDYITIVKIPNAEGTLEYHVLRVKENTNKVEILQEDYIYSYSDWTGKEGSANDAVVSGVVYEASIYKNFSTYLKYETKTFPVSKLDGANVTFFKVPENSIFFLGDNRANSNDSRALGCFDLSKIEGRVCAIVRDGTAYEGNNMWWINRIKGFFEVIWREILVFFGASA